MSNTTERDWIEEVGGPVYRSVESLVAALECDYDRLEKLREEGLTKVTAPSAWASYLINGDDSGISDAERAEADAMVEYVGLGSPVGCEDAGFVHLPDYGALAGDCQIYTFYDNKDEYAERQKELAELREAAGECESRDDAEQRIHEDALSVEVRSGWYVPGEGQPPAPEEFNLLLCTGGPAARIRGELDEHGEPTRAWLEVQDWGKPWTQYFKADQDVLLTYARCFYFGEG